MKQIVTTGIVLTRTNYGEADRILTIITPDNGKLRLMAKGVRRQKSKLAGGIELFSTSSITYIPGRGEIGTLVSSRLAAHYRNIVKDINRTNLGYDMLKSIHKLTQDECGPEFYELLQVGMASLDDSTVPLTLVEAWFYAHLLQELGREPNLHTDAAGKQLDPLAQYAFDYENMAFVATDAGTFTAKHIKLLRLLLAQPPQKLAVIADAADTAGQLMQLLKRLI